MNWNLFQWTEYFFSRVDDTNRKQVGKAITEAVDKLLVKMFVVIYRKPLGGIFIPVDCLWAT